MRLNDFNPPNPMPLKMKAGMAWAIFKMVEASLLSGDGELAIRYFNLLLDPAFEGQCTILELEIQKRPGES